MDITIVDITNLMMLDTGNHYEVFKPSIARFIDVVDDVRNAVTIAASRLAWDNIFESLQTLLERRTGALLEVYTIKSKLYPSPACAWAAWRADSSPTPPRASAIHQSGLSHFIEHMIFKGTARRSAYQIAKEFDAIGGHTNAFTPMENTCYHAKVMDSHLTTTDPRRFAFSLLNAILGGNMSSRLFQEIREKRGLAYSVYSLMMSHVDTGMLGVYAGVGAPNVAQTWS